MPSGKLKVGFVYDDSLDSADGVAQYVKTLGAWLTSQDQEVRYLVGETKLKSWSGGRVYSLAKNLPVSFNRNRLSTPLPASKHVIREVLDREHFDVLHIQMPHSPLFAQRVVNMAAPRTAIIGTFHILPAGQLSRVGSRLLRYTYGRGLGRFDRVMSVSAPAAEFARAIFGLKTEVVGNIIDTGRFKPGNRRSERSAQIVFLGRLVKRKGCFQLLEAFKLLSPHRPSLKLIVAGNGPERHRLERFVQKNGLSRQVTFTGYVSEHKKRQLLADADIACFPSLYGESFGVVLLEAMAAGAGVVLAGDNPGYRSVLDGQPKLIIHPGDTAAFAQRLQQLIVDKELVKSLHSWQKKHVLRYDVDTIGPKILEMYQNVQRSKA